MAENADTGGELAMGGDVDAVVRPAPMLARLLAEHRPAVELIDLRVTATYTASEGMKVKVVGVARYGDDRRSTWVEDQHAIAPDLLAGLEAALVAIARVEGADIREKVELAAAGDLIVARRKGEL